MQNIEDLLREPLARAFELVAGAPADPMVRRSQHADYQADGALALARRLARPPREIAQDVLRHVDLSQLCSGAEVSGPGYINLIVANDLLNNLLLRVSADERLGVELVESPETVVVDYSAPNVAKEMHVGHLRSTIIGDAAVRVLEWLGYKVIRQNHIGDWGTPFGMLIEHLLDLGEGEAAHELSVGDLDEFYKQARTKFDNDPEFAHRARRRVVTLQSGDPTTLRLWHLLVDASKTYFNAVYRRLDVRLTDADFDGESSYNDMLPPVVEALGKCELLNVSNGALCVFPAGFRTREGTPLPLIVRKSDGGYGYPATDLATIRHRIQELRARRILYVVGMPQRQHFAMIFAVAEEAGWLDHKVEAEHIGFGSILGKDGRILRSRTGSSIKLIALLDEAVSRAAAVVEDKNPELEPSEMAYVAHAVGIGAVKYADLSTDRIKDYVFDYNKMLTFDGNTAPYLQYAHARICSILRKAGSVPASDARLFVVNHPAERKLALHLLDFGALVRNIVQNLEFHRLANYLYTVATSFTHFYEQCPVLRADSPVRGSRLALCHVSARILACGLSLLGIEAPEQM